MPAMESDKGAETPDKAFVTPDKKAVLFVVALASFVTPFMGSSINVALPRIGDEFALNAVVLSWVSISFLLAAAVLLLPLGRIADIYGRKRIFTYGMAVYTVSSFLCGTASSIPALLFFRLLQGAGSAMTFATGLAIITAAYPPGERGRAIGITVSMVYIGLSVGPFLGGLFTEQWGWRSIFFANVPMGLVILFFLIRLKGEWRGAEGERFDPAGAAIYSFALVSLMLGFSLLPGPLGFGLTAAGLLGLWGFASLQFKAKHPLLDVSVFRGNRAFTLSNVAAFINYSATFAAGFLLSLYLQYAKGLSPLEAGLVLVAQPVVMALFSPYAGKLSDKVEPMTVATAGMALTAAGLAFFVFLTRETTVGFITAGLVLTGLGFALFSSPNANAIMSSVQRRHYGVASGMLSTMRLVGQMLSMGVAALIFAIYMGGEKITQANLDMFLSSVRAAFGVFALLCLAGVFASAGRGKLKRGQ